LANSGDKVRFGFLVAAESAFFAPGAAVPVVVEKRVFNTRAWFGVFTGATLYNAEEEKTLFPKPRVYSIILIYKYNFT